MDVPKRVSVSVTPLTRQLMEPGAGPWQVAAWAVVVQTVNGLHTSPASFLGSSRPEQQPSAMQLWFSRTTSRLPPPAGSLPKYWKHFAQLPAAMKVAWIPSHESGSHLRDGPQLRRSGISTNWLTKRAPTSSRPLMDGGSARPAPCSHRALRSADAKLGDLPPLLSWRRLLRWVFIGPVYAVALCTPAVPAARGLPIPDDYVRHCRLLRYTGVTGQPPSGAPGRDPKTTTTTYVKRMWCAVELAARW